MAKDHWHSFTDSSNISGAGIQGGKLTVEFHKNGKVTGVYAYTTNELNLCCRLEMAASKGQFVQQHIRDLPYAKVG